MKNILFIAKKMANGGSERVIASLADKLKDKYNVIIVAFKNDKPDYFPNVKIIDLKTTRTSNPFKKIKYVFIRYNAIKKIKKQYNIDCCISFMTQPNLLNILTKSKEKTIVSIRNNLNKKKHKRLAKVLGKIFYRKADKIVTVSKEMEEDFIKEYSLDIDKVTTIYNAYDEEKIEKAKKEKIKEKELFINKKTIITVGRLAYQKGYWHLIRAFPEVLKKHPDSQLIILGRGSYKKYLQKLINDLKLEEKIKIIKFKKDPYNYLYNSDLFVSTSLFEGMANAIIEAIACDLPIIASNCKYGNKEILSDNWTSIGNINSMKEEEYGILIPICDGKKYDAKDKLTKEEKEIAKAIIYVLENKEKLKQLSEKRKENFKLEDRINEWIKIIEN